MKRGFGIVGAGEISATHADAIASLPNARLVAVTDVEPDRATTLAARYECAAEPDLEALLARDDVDVVSICVPSGLHADVGIRAAAAGKHLVVEKPLDVSLEAADRLLAAVRTAGVLMTVISQHRFDPGLVELRRLLDDGQLGRLVLGEASTKWYRSQAYYDSGEWRGTWALDGGALMNQGIHYLDLLLWSMGPVAEVTAVVATETHEMEAEDSALAVLRFASGAVGTVVASTAVYPGFAQRLEVSGTSGTVVVEDGEIIRCELSADQADPGLRGSLTARGDGQSAAAADPAGLHVDSHAAQISDLLDAIDNGRPPAVTGDDGRAALQAVCAVYESARAGCAVRLPMAFDVRDIVPGTS
ncbi:MAG: Gfo/Idh/MocA family oxidoreductase [Actinobacteria bacterium]|nr:Gfo/Idh/MocA family oxidoreductase [Actinomycetota bacterium]MBO0834188.1 Gfo/Idh/MocA family oxidoreductase [Actinomycetota bacterium]